MCLHMAPLWPPCESYCVLHLQALGLTRRLSAKRTFLNNLMQQVERYGDAHAKVHLPHVLLCSSLALPA